MKKRLAVLLAFVAGLYWFLEFFWHELDLTGIGIPFSENLSNHQNVFFATFVAIGAGAIALGIINILRVHGKTVLHRRKGWYNSAALFFAMILMLVFGFWNHYGQRKADVVFDAGQMGEVQLKSIKSNAKDTHVREITREAYTQRIPRVKQVRNAIEYFTSPPRKEPDTLRWIIEYGKWVFHEEPILEKLFERKGLMDGLLELDFRGEKGGSITFPVGEGFGSTGWTAENSEKFEMEVFYLPLGIEGLYSDLAEIVERYQVRKDESLTTSIKRRKIAENKKKNVAIDVLRPIATRQLPDRQDQFTRGRRLVNFEIDLRKGVLEPLEALQEGGLSGESKEPYAAQLEKLNKLLLEIEEANRPVVELDDARKKGLRALDAELARLRVEKVVQIVLPLKSQLEAEMPASSEASNVHESLMEYFKAHKDQLAFAGDWIRFYAALRTIFNSDIPHLNVLLAQMQAVDASKAEAKASVQKQIKTKAASIVEKLDALAARVRPRSLDDLRKEVDRNSQMPVSFAEETEPLFKKFGEVIQNTDWMTAVGSDTKTVASAIEALAEGFVTNEKSKDNILKGSEEIKDKLVVLYQRGVDLRAQKAAFDRKYSPNYPKSKVEEKTKLAVTFHYLSESGEEHKATLLQPLLIGDDAKSMIARFSVEKLHDAGIRLDGIQKVTLSTNKPLRLYAADAKMIRKGTVFYVQKIWTQVLFFGLLNALGATMFSLLAFFIVSASYRAFRIRSMEAGLLMVVAFVVMLGQIPATAEIWNGFGESKQWLLLYVNGGAQRAVAFGSALAGFAISLRIWLGMEKGLY